MRLKSEFAWVIVLSLLIVALACGEDEGPDQRENGTTGSFMTATVATDASAVAVTQPAAAAAGSTMTMTGAQSMPKQWSAPPQMQLDESRDYRAVLKTNKGEITIDLFEKDAPNTVNNFVFLAEQGYYSNVPFHRVIKDFMIQTGDPTGTGRGGPGYKFADEPVTREYTRGTVAMANAGPNTNGSQFFIVHGDSPLPKNYTIFGQVTDGLDVVDAIANTPVKTSPSGEPSAPTQALTIESVEIVSD